MSKNTSSSKFRKVDVDAYDEEQYIEDTEDDSASQGPNEGEVNQCLSQYPFF